MTPMVAMVMSSRSSLNLSAPLMGRLSIPSASCGSGNWPAGLTERWALFSASRSASTVGEVLAARSRACAKVTGSAHAAGAMPTAQDNSHA